MNNETHCPKRPTLLVVDDTPDNVVVLSSLLKDSYRIKVATCGPKALKIAVTGEPPDLVLLDIMMPGMDGYEVCRRLKENAALRDIPVIFLSALNEAEDKVKAFQAGGVDYVTKPFQSEEVRARVETHLKIRRLQVKLVERNKQLQQANDNLQAAHGELTRKNRQLEQLNAEKNRFLGMAAHDLRNPISAIGGYCSLFLGGILGELTDQQRQIIERVKISSKFMHQLLEDLLDISQIEAGKLELRLAPVDLAALIADNVKLNRMFAEKKQIGIKFVPRCAPPPLNLDAAKIEQVLNNLSSNAIKFSQPGTEITVELITEDDQLVIVVRDQGQGIAPHEIDKVFKPFEKTSTRSTSGEKSTGLGMAIVKKIVEGHQGKIWLESAVGVGTTFYVALPLPVPKDAPGVLSTMT
ncbi:MAG: hybrid sensor histidine kinase/response regulator [bacterium]|nr:hybrid sensor histidine kinase/response regulator [bacterium]